MKFFKAFAISVVAVSMSSTMSCSSDSDPETDSGQTDTEQTDNNNDNSDNNDTNDTSDNNDNNDANDSDNGNNENPGQVGVVGPPQFLLAECDSLPISEAQATNNEDAPTSLSVGQLVQGQLISESTVLNKDIWQVDLQPGNYHLIIDGWLASEELGSIGAKVTTVGDNETLYFKPGSDYFLRGYEYLEIVNPTTIVMKVEPIYNKAMNYVMGIFANGASVPTPRFTRCPSVTRISLDETQSLTLPDVNALDDYRWYRLNLAAGVYNFDASMDSGQGSLGYRMNLFQRFGDYDERETIANETTSNNSLSSNDPFTVLDDNDVWIRLQNVYNSESPIFEFTVTQ
jgi:hypothetical protein